MLLKTTWIKSKEKNPLFFDDQLNIENGHPFECIVQTAPKDKGIDSYKCPRTLDSHISSQKAIVYENVDSESISNGLHVVVCIRNYISSKEYFPIFID